MGVLDLVIHFGLRPLPIDWCSKLGSYLGLFGRLRYPASHRRILKAWATLRPDEADPAAARDAAYRLWRCVGRTMGEYSVLDRLWQAGRIEVEGVEHLDAARDAGRPRLVMGLHLGNWEAIPPTLIAVGHPGCGIYLPPVNRFDHWIAVTARERYGARLIAPGQTATREALKALKENSGIFIIYVDEFIRGKVQAPAFGRRLRPNGNNIAYVARLAAMTGADIIPAYCVRQGETAYFKVQFLAPVALENSGTPKESAAANVARLDAAISPIIRNHLDQWFYGLDLDLES
ncbi:MAG: lysophospholipid acyltransferase family protein [Hyphomicrobiaceae bacterium]